MPAGTYRLVYDAIIIFPVDVTFELIHRRDGSDTVLAMFSESFAPNPGGGFMAQEREIDLDAPAIDFVAGDQLVYRYSGTNSQSQMSYIPVGLPESEGGRFTNITLPR